MDNIVVVVMDSLRKDKLGIYNEEVEFTQNIDEFSEKSKVYGNAVSNSSWTLPVHASIFTGLYPWEHGATQRNLKLETESKTLAEKLSDEGFSTGCFTTNAWISEHAKTVDGFDKVENFDSNINVLNSIIDRFATWVEEDDSWLRRQANKIGDYFFHYFSDHKDAEEVLGEAKKFIDSEKSSFTFINLMDAHEPYKPPKEYLEKHDATKRSSQICQNTAEFYRGKEVDFEEIERFYNASVDYMDDKLGEFLESLEEETMVVLLSDHGQMLGEKGHYGHQFSVDDILVEVPLIVKSPNSGNGRDNRQVELMDLHKLIISETRSGDIEIGSEYVKGLYEFPDMMSTRIPRKRWDELFKQYKFVKKGDKKITRIESEDGDVEYRSCNLGDDETEMEKRVDDLGSASPGEEMKDKEEMIQEKLEKLGYG